MPQLDKFIFFSQLFWLALLLGLLYLLLAGWLLPRLLRSLKFRRVHRSRLARLADAAGRRLAQLTPSLALLGRRSVPLLGPALDRSVSQLVTAQLRLRRWLLPVPPVRPLPPRVGFLPRLLPVPVLPVFWSAPLPAFQLLPLLFRSTWSVLPPFPRLPLPPRPILDPLDSLVPLPSGAALLALSLAQRLIRWELLLWMDPLLSPLPLEEFGLLSLRRLVRLPLVQLSSVL